MAQTLTTGTKLDAMRQRAGLTFDALATAAGYATASGVQRWLAPDFDSDLSLKVAQRLAKAFVGTPVKPDEVWALAGIPVPNAITIPFSDELGTFPLQRDLPVYGTALGSVIEMGSVAVEQTNFAESEVVTYLKRPAALKGRPDAYAVYIQGSSMSPRWQDGELAFIDPKGPLKIGDDVLVFLCDSDGDGGDVVTSCLLKRLVRRTSAYVELEQFSPAATFQVPVERILKTHRVLPFSELFS